MGLLARLGLARKRQDAKAASKDNLWRIIVPSWMDNQPVWTTWSADKAVSDGYKANIWVYACIRKITQSVASVPLLTYHLTDGEDERIPGHPLEKLLQRPNKFQAGQDIMEFLVAHLYLAGNGYWGIIEANGKPRELLVLLPQYVKPIPSSTDYLKGYELNVSGQPVTLAPSQVFHVMFIDPANLWIGMSPMQAAGRVIDTDTEQINWNKVAMQNRAVADGAFVVKETLKEEQYQDLKKIVREQHTGSGNARVPWVLHSGATWQQMSLSPVEMDFIESRKMNREDICAVYQVPPILVGIMDDASYNNYATALKSFWTDTIAPLMNDICTAINVALAPRFGDDVIIKPDYTNVPAMQEILKERVDTATKLFSMGVPFNQINDRLGLGFAPLEHGDEGYLPLSLMPAGTTKASEVLDISKGKQTNASECKEKHGKAFWLQTEEQKTAYWKAYDRDRRVWENAIAKKIADRFDAEVDVVVKAYKDAGTIDAALESQRNEWKKILMSVYVSVIEHFGNRLMDQLLKTGFGPSESKLVFDPWADNIIQWVSTWAAKKIIGIEDTTKQRIATVIKQGIDANEGTAEIAKRIKDAYADFSRYRSFVIARTEVGAASGFASHASAKQTGLQIRKQWVSSRDDRVRDSHNVGTGIDGEIREMDELYSNGCMFPGDPAGPPEEVIQCRCVENYLSQEPE